MNGSRLSPATIRPPAPPSQVFRRALPVLAAFSCRLRRDRIEGMTEYLDDEIVASDPARVPLSRRRYRRLRGVTGIFWELLTRLVGTRYVKYLEEHLWHGTYGAALVVSRSPLLVAAYTEDIDCVVMLHFPEWVAREHRLEEGSRLLAVCVYPPADEVARDIEPGPGNSGLFRNVDPQIAEFLSDDVDRIEERKRQINEEEWERCERLAATYLDRHGPCARDGAPFFNSTPARLDDPIKKKRARGGPFSLRTWWFVTVTGVLFLIHIIPPENFEKVAADLIPKLRLLSAIGLAWIALGTLNVLRRERLGLARWLWVAGDAALCALGLVFPFGG